MSQCFARTPRSTLATRAGIGMLPRSDRVSGLPLIHGIARRRGTDEAGPEPTTRQLGLGIAKVPINGLLMGGPGFGCGVTGYHGQEVPGQPGVKSSKPRVKCRQRLQLRKRDPRARDAVLDHLAVTRPGGHGVAMWLIDPQLGDVSPARQASTAPPASGETPRSSNSSSNASAEAHRDC